MSFSLHPQLAGDTVILGNFPLCRVLLMNDRRFPWLILVPQREHMQEIFDLITADQRQLWEETAQTAVKLRKHCNADKMNVAALGNMVPQLHVHVIARLKTDAAWPKPVWCASQPPTPYGETEIARLSDTLRGALGI